MFNILFIAILALLLYALLRWGFDNLLGEKWQVIAAIPVYKNESGYWHGINLTFYGLVTACAYVFSVVIVFLLLGALQVPAWHTASISAAVLLFAIPASNLVARLVEKRRYSFTVAGAAFVGIIVSPWAILLINARYAAAAPVPMIPVLAAFAIAYAFGEGIGRLACISFGCCYGKPLSASPSWVQRLCRDRCFVFQGKIKKIAFEGKMDGQKVVPVQGMTCSLYVVTGLISTLLFLYGCYAAALLLSLAITQGWRFFSETLRADYRGGGTTSVYQVLALIGMAYILIITLLFRSTTEQAPDIVYGLVSLWHPGIIVFIQVLWLMTFIYSGRSMVTASLVSIHLHPEHVEGRLAEDKTAIISA